MDHCRQCGTCCRKGGPAIHREDKKLLENGYIPLRFLFTIRKDEPVYDNIQGCIISAPSDIVRVRNLENTNTCVFFNSERNSCGIYDVRPLECRTLECWNTAKIEAIYQQERLCRQEILSPTPHLKDLTAYHERRCAYRVVNKLIRRLKQGENKHVLDALYEMLSFDNHIRLLAVEKSICKKDILDFLLGLPLEKTLPRMGLTVLRKKKVNG